MRNYIELTSEIKKHNVARGIRPDRTKTGTLSKFGMTLRYDLQEAFPLMPWRRISLIDIARELAWFLEGSVDVNRLVSIGSNIWNKWALPEDHIVSLAMTPYNRAEYYAKVMQKPVGEITKKLETDFKSMEEGHKWLDEQGVPRTFDMVMEQAGSIGPMYGQQWRGWSNIYMDKEGRIIKSTIDQVKNLIMGLINSPYSRRHILTAWNVSDIPDEGVNPHENVKNGKMAIAPCHCFSQYYVQELTTHERIGIYNRTLGKADNLYINPANYNGDDEMNAFLTDAGVPSRSLSCLVYMRSNDIVVGAAYNIASYALLTHLLASECGYAVGELVYEMGDAHIYQNHLDALDIMEQRYYDDVTNDVEHAAQLDIRGKLKISDFMGTADGNLEPAEIVIGKLKILTDSLTNYNPHPAIAGIPVAV